MAAETAGGCVDADDVGNDDDDDGDDDDGDGDDDEKLRCCTTPFLRLPVVGEEEDSGGYRCCGCVWWTGQHKDGRRRQ